jgi:hypothetical protein
MMFAFFICLAERNIDILFSFLRSMPFALFAESEEQDNKDILRLIYS